MGQNNASEDINTLSFEQAMAELDSVVSQLESGSAPLEKSIELYTRGTALKARCEALLKEAQANIEKITFDESGAATGTASFDPEA